MIDSVAELMSALERSRGGEVISLAPGTYPGIAIRDFQRNVPVIITGQGAYLPGLTIDRSSGLTFTKIEFFVPNPGQFSYRVNRSNNISFDGVYVHGILDGKPQGKPSGISITYSSNIVVKNSTFEQLRRGIGVASSENIKLEGNRFKFMQTDGVMVSSTSGILIYKNEFSDFFPTEGDHPDAIQFLTSGTDKPSKKIRITENIAWRGSGSSIQGIFLRDEKKTLPYEDVEISRNILVGTGYNGIVVAGGVNVNISENKLLSYNGKENQNWIMVKRGEGVRSYNNAAIKFGYVDVVGLDERGNKHNKPISEQNADKILSEIKLKMR